MYIENIEQLDNEPAASIPFLMKYFPQVIVWSCSNHMLIVTCSNLILQELPKHSHFISSIFLLVFGSHFTRCNILVQSMDFKAYVVFSVTTSLLYRT